MFSGSNLLLIFEKHLPPSAIVEFRHSAVGVTGNPLGHIQSSSVLLGIRGLIIADLFAT
jgi:hypothetical protein